MEYKRGQTVRLSATFTQAGSAVDPDTVTLRVRGSGTPDPITLVYGQGTEIVRDSVGAYHADLPFTVIGRAYYRWEGTGSGVAGVDERFFNVEWSAFS